MTKEEKIAEDLFEEEMSKRRYKYEESQKVDTCEAGGRLDDGFVMEVRLYERINGKDQEVMHRFRYVYPTLKEATEMLDKADPEYKADNEDYATTLEKLEWYKPHSV